jgi:hypothetical protein
LSDRLALANAIEDAGIPRDKAQRLASAISDNVATKADIAPLAAKVETVGADVRSGSAQNCRRFAPRCRARGPN